MENKFEKNKQDIINLFKSYDFIKEAWLFGSYAYGHPNEESDLDLCVVVQDSYDTGENFEKVNFALFSLLINRQTAHDLIMLDETTKRQEKDNPKYVYFPIFTQGIRLL